MSGNFAIKGCRGGSKSRVDRVVGTVYSLLEKVLSGHQRVLQGGFAPHCTSYPTWDGMEEVTYDQ